jgi:hypothetical protein
MALVQNILQIEPASIQDHYHSGMMRPKLAFLCTLDPIQLQVTGLAML